MHRVCSLFTIYSSALYAFGCKDNKAGSTKESMFMVLSIICFCLYLVSQQVIFDRRIGLIKGLELP